jgi:hypothetical protein
MNAQRDCEMMVMIEREESMRWWRWKGLSEIIEKSMFVFELVSLIFEMREEEHRFMMLGFELVLCVRWKRNGFEFASHQDYVAIYT